MKTYTHIAFLNDRGRYLTRIRLDYKTYQIVYRTLTGNAAAKCAVNLSRTCVGVILFGQTSKSLASS